MEKMSREERARQFMPFAALRGFEELIRQQERVTSPRRELSEEAGERLSARLSALHRGDLVRVIYYKEDAYVTMDGIVSEIDPVERRLRVIKTYIPFEDVWEISLHAESQEG